MASNCNKVPRIPWNAVPRARPSDVTRLRQYCVCARARVCVCVIKSPAAPGPAPPICPVDVSPCGGEPSQTETRHKGSNPRACSSGWSAVIRKWQRVGCGWRVSCGVGWGDLPAHCARDEWGHGGRAQSGLGAPMHEIHVGSAVWASGLGHHGWEDRIAAAGRCAQRVEGLHNPRARRHRSAERDLERVKGSVPVVTGWARQQRARERHDSQPAGGLAGLVLPASRVCTCACTCSRGAGLNAV